MCTDRELRIKIRMYCEITAEKSRLEKLQKELSDSIKKEVDSRNETVTDPAQRDIFDNVQIITSRLNEKATKEGRQFLKDNIKEDIDRYINVTVSRYINTAAAKKI